MFQKAVPTKDVTNPVSLPSFLLYQYVGYSSPLCLYEILIHFTDNRSNYSSPSFASTTFPNLPRIPDPNSEMSHF